MPGGRLTIRGAQPAELAILVFQKCSDPPVFSHSIHLRDEEKPITLPSFLLIWQLYVGKDCSFVNTGTLTGKRVVMWGWPVPPIAIKNIFYIPHNKLCSMTLHIKSSPPSEIFC